MFKVIFWTHWLFLLSRKSWKHSVLNVIETHYSHAYVLKYIKYVFIFSGTLIFVFWQRIIQRRHKKKSFSRTFIPLLSYLLLVFWNYKYVFHIVSFVPTKIREWRMYILVKSRALIFNHGELARKQKSILEEIHQTEIFTGPWSVMRIFISMFNWVLEFWQIMVQPSQTCVLKI